MMRCVRLRECTAVRVVTGRVERLPEVLRRLFPGGRPFLVTHPSLLQLFRRRVRAWAHTVLTVPEGERAKSVRGLTDLWRGMLAAGCDRSSVCVILGGGVVGDVGGFAASTFMRGLPVVQVPTTLLAMVDSAIGGKTGVNLPEGKNLVGTFHQPRLIWCDVTLLSSLPLREIRSGFGEIVKYGILDRSVYRLLDAADPRAVVSVPFCATPLVRKLILACAETKLRIVARDQHERTGLRECLNLGHTVGHAVETVSRYSGYSHGEAVALGLIAEINLARRLNVCSVREAQRMLDLVGRYLPPRTFAPWVLQMSADLLISVMRRDKKVRCRRLRFALPRRIGAVATYEDVPVRQVALALRDLQAWVRSA